MTESFLAEMVLGWLRWDLVWPFPRQEKHEQLGDDQRAAAVTHFLADRLDPEDDELPHDFCAGLRGSDYLKLQVPVGDGGLGLSDFSTFQVVSCCMNVSPTAGFVIGTHNGIGLPALLPLLHDGLLRDLVVRRLSDGILSGAADTEPTGAANRRFSTIATPANDCYSLSGRKVFISNGLVADELIVSATVANTGETGLFLVDTAQPGFVVQAEHALMGFAGIPLGAIVLDRVHVPAVRALARPGRGWHHLLLDPINARGRMYLVSAAACAIGIRCLDFQKDFARRRAVDGLPLPRYPAVQQLIATSLADMFAMDTVARFCLLGSDQANLSARFLERHAAKNICSLACWRIVDRTMSLLAAEGAETAASKRRRGAPALPLERLFRDARMLRIAGGVDFNVAMRAARLALARHRNDNAGRTIGHTGAPEHVACLSDPNRRHLDAVTDAVAALASTCRRLAERNTAADSLDSELTLIALGHIMHELFTMTVVLARAATSESANGTDGDPDRQALADIYCTHARDRLLGLWRDLTHADSRPYQHITDHWLAESCPVPKLAHLL